MDYSHRRAASERAAYETQASSITNGSARRPPADRVPGVPPKTTHRQRMPDGRDSTAANCSTAHARSLSCDTSAYTWEAPPAAGRLRYGSLQSANAQPLPTAALAPLALAAAAARRGSESSTSSALSSGTATADSASAWSAATTPETMSPTSPSGSLLLQSPPPADPPSPTAAHQTATHSRQLRAHACAQPVAKRFQALRVIETPVPEEEEHADRSLRIPRPPSSKDAPESSTVSNLHQRRQQQKAARGPQPKQPVRLRLSPLPSPPLDSPGPWTLKPSRSMPQIRSAASGPPPSGPLPPLPAVPKLSPFALPTPMSFQGPLTPAAASSPPHPTGPPPPPPHDRPAVPLSGSTKTLKASATVATITEKSAAVQQQQQQPHQGEPSPAASSPWEDELRRHKLLLQQFPQGPEEPATHRLPKLSRTHRSLGNLRARSRSLSRAAASSFQDEQTMAPPEPPLSRQSSSSFLHRGGAARAQRPSTAKTSRDAASRMLDPLPPLPQASGQPRVSVFEDDSDDDGAAVRRFVRNLFSRRTRSSELPAGKDHGAAGLGMRDVSGGKSSVKSLKAAERNGHNDRKKNYSSSSAFSVATTVGASTVASAASTIAEAETDTSNDCYDADSCRLDGHSSPSPRTSTENPPAPQKGPLLSRMFVRRSH